MQTPAPEPQDDGAAPGIDALEEALIELDPAWIVLAQLRLGTPPDDLSADYVLLHRERGVALLDRAPGNGRDPVPPFRKFLDAEGFSGFFPGTLPIVHSIVDPGEAALGKRLDEAFAAAPELTIADAEWAEAVNSLLVAPEPQADDTGESEADAGDDAGLADIAGMPSFRPSREKREAEGWTESLAATVAADARLAEPPPLRYGAAGGDDAAAPRALPPLRSPIEDQPIYLKRRRSVWPAVLVLLICLAGGAAAWLLLAPTTESDVAALVRSTPANPPAGTPIANGATPDTAGAAKPQPAAAPPAVPDIPPVPPESPNAAAAPATQPPAAPHATPPQIELAAPAAPLDQHDEAAANGPPAPAAKPAEKPPQVPSPPADVAAQLVPKAPPPPAETAPLAVVPAAKPAPQVAVETPNDSGKPDNPAPAAPPRRSAEQHQPAAHPARAARSTPPARERPAGERRTRTRPERAVAHAEPAHAKERRAATANPPATEPAAPEQLPQAPQYSGPPIDAGQLPPLAAEQPLAPPQPSPAPVEERRPAPRSPEATALAAPMRLFPTTAPDAEDAPPTRHPSTTRQLAVAPAADAPSGNNGVCRIYHAVTTVMGQQRPVKGLACRRTDGTWQVVTQTPE